MNQNQMDFDIRGDEVREECGVFGIYDFDGNDVASTIYYGLFALQHRGQESCGIAVSDTEGPKGKVSAHKGMGSIYTGCDRTTSWKYRCRPCKIFNSRKQYQRECAASGIKLCKRNPGVSSQRKPGQCTGAAS